MNTATEKKGCGVLGNVLPIFCSLEQLGGLGGEKVRWTGGRWVLCCDVTRGVTLLVRAVTVSCLSFIFVEINLRALCWRVLVSSVYFGQAGRS